MPKDMSRKLEDACNEVGLDLVWKSPHHCQIIGGIRNYCVNCWPNSKKGFKMQLPDEQSKTGTIQDAITLAGYPKTDIPPFNANAMQSDEEYQNNLRTALLAILGLTSLHWDGNHCIRDRIRDIACNAVENK